MSAGSLDGKVALLTGGAGGIGGAVARLFVAEGAQVVLADVRQEPGEALAAELGGSALYLHLDVTSAPDWDAALAATAERFGRLDVLLNNAGVFSIRSIEECSLDEYMATVMVNQVGGWLGMKTALPLMRSTGGGAIVNISSIAGLQGSARAVAYHAAKWAMRGMSRCAALEFAADGIRVNSIYPGTIATDMPMSTGMVTDVRGTMGEGVPLGRVGEPEEVAQLVLYLASAAGSYCTGAEFVIDGGVMSGRMPPPTI